MKATKPILNDDFSLSPKDLIEIMVKLDCKLGLLWPAFDYNWSPDDGFDTMPRSIRDSYKRKLDRFDKVFSLTHRKNRKRSYMVGDGIGIVVCNVLEGTMPLSFPEGMFQPVQARESDDNAPLFVKAAEFALAGGDAWLVFPSYLAPEPQISAGPNGYICWVEDSLQRKKRLAGEMISERWGGYEFELKNQYCAEVPLTELLRSVLLLFGLSCPKQAEGEQGGADELKSFKLDHAERELIRLIRSRSVDKVELSVREGDVAEIIWQGPCLPKTNSVEKLSSIKHCHQIRVNTRDGVPIGYIPQFKQRFK